MEDEELMKMFNTTLKGREIILFLLIVVINGLIYIDLDIGLNTCTKANMYYGAWVFSMLTSQNVFSQKWEENMVGILIWLIDFFYLFFLIVMINGLT